MAKKISVQQIESQVEQLNGNVSAIARKLGVARNTVYARIAKSSALQRRMDDARESMLDNAESVLYKKVLEGSTPELIFFLKTQGHKRGYTERQSVELSGPAGGGIEIKTIRVHLPAEDEAVGNE